MAMKPRDFKDAQSIIDDLKQGILGRRDLTALLIYVREHLPEDMIRDIAHCVAHSDRDRGYAYKHIKRFAANFAAATDQGGVIDVHAVFDKGELISKLAADLEATGLSISRDDVERNYALIESRLSDILCDTNMLIEDACVKSCKFEEKLVDGTPKLIFVVFTSGLDSNAVVPVPESVGIACPVFS